VDSRQWNLSDVSLSEVRGMYEVDHLVSLAIGGSNSIRNLWPEPLRLSENGYDLGAVTKDRLEDKLHWLVVSGQLDLKEAQNAIATNWIDAYRKYIGELPLYTYETPLARLNKGSDHALPSSDIHRSASGRIDDNSK
jgi:hypothetical protein